MESKIPHEELFKEYLLEDGITSGRNYISWLRHINKFVVPFNKSGILSQKELKKIKIQIVKTAPNRPVFNNSKGISNLKSTLNKYFLFLNSNSFIDLDINEIKNLSAPETEKKILIDARKGQGKFRENVMKKWDNKCAISVVKNPNFLIASHIKAWRFSKDNPKERLDPFNALPLTPNLDKLFDKYYISFSYDGKIIISHKLNKLERKYFGINNKTILNLKSENRKYLKHHREQFLLNNKKD